MVTEDEKRVLRGAEQVYTGMKVHYGTIMRLIISSWTAMMAVELGNQAFLWQTSLLTWLFDDRRWMEWNWCWQRIAYLAQCGASNNFHQCIINSRSRRTFDVETSEKRRREVERIISIPAWLVPRIRWAALQVLRTLCKRLRPEVESLKCRPKRSVTYDQFLVYTVVAAAGSAWFVVQYTLLLVCVSWTITGQPRNRVFIRRV